MIRKRTVLTALFLVVELVCATRACPQSVRIAPPAGPVVSGTKSCVVGAETIVTTGATVGSLSCLICNPGANTTDVKIGDATPDLTLVPGACVSLDISDLKQIYCQYVTSNTTIQYLCTKGP